MSIELDKYKRYRVNKKIKNEANEVVLVSFSSLFFSFLILFLKRNQIQYKEAEIISLKRKFEEDKENINNNKRLYEIELNNKINTLQQRLIEKEKEIQQQQQEIKNLKTEKKEQQDNDNQIKLLKILQQNTTKLLTQFPTNSPLRQSFLHLISKDLSARETHQLLNSSLSTVKLAKKINQKN